MLCRAVRRLRLRAEATCVARIAGLRCVAAIFASLGCIFITNSRHSTMSTRIPTRIPGNIPNTNVVDLHCHRMLT